VPLRAAPVPAVAAPLQARALALQPVSDRTYGAEDRNVVPPLAVRESWASLADVFAVRTGVIEIVIDAAGSVESAAMNVAVNAVYDRLALTTAKRWRYKPATLDGVPVKFRKVILLDLKATR
jgi:TonB family protein